jgi:hypothetical protein
MICYLNVYSHIPYNPYNLLAIDKYFFTQQSFYARIKVPIA